MSQRQAEVKLTAFKTQTNVNVYLEHRMAQLPPEEVFFLKLSPPVDLQLHFFKALLPNGLSAVHVKLQLIIFARYCIFRFKCKFKASTVPYQAQDNDIYVWLHGHARNAG
jgi:hypothetical protein